jgi:predicted transcriptional regulator
MSDTEKLIELTAEIVSSMVGNNSVATADVPVLIKSVHGALSSLGAPVPEPEVEKPKGAVSARASIKPDGLISMIDGKKYQTLRRHITRHGYTPESYREAFGLPRDYPMTSANYSELRRGMAKLIGLGRKAADAITETVTPSSPEPAAVEPTPVPAKPGRKPRAAKAQTTAPAEAPAPEPVAIDEAPTAAEEAPAKPKRGRPRKTPVDAAPADAASGEAAAPAEAPEAAPAEDAAPAPKKRRARK